MSFQDSLPTRLIGIGNWYRGDDAAGLLVADLLEADAPGLFDILQQSGGGVELMDAWKGWHQVFLVDAVRSGSPPGTIHRFDAHSGSLPEDLFAASTHTFGVGHAIELARVMRKLPEFLIIYGIEGEAFSQGDEVTPSVIAAVKATARAILAEVREE